MIITEYMWNADTYRAEDAVRRVMAHIVGREAVPSLLVFRHHYLRILRAYPLEKPLDQVADAMRKRYALTDEQFSRQPGPTSPPIGWHIWHASRWSDRFQASFQQDSLEGAYKGALPNEIWKKESMARQWGLGTESLGLLETGATMSVETAVSVTLLGKGLLLGYAGRMFEAVEETINGLTDKMLVESRFSILPKLEKTPDEKPVFVGDLKTTVFSELLFQVTHTGRHLGMMEALQGALFGMSGSVSV
jgi:hypothetical protein